MAVDRFDEDVKRDRAVYDGSAQLEGSVISQVTSRPRWQEEEMAAGR